MNQFSWNLILAIVWVVLTADFSVLNFAFGFLVAYILIILVEGKGIERGYGRQFVRGILFFFFYAKEVVLSSLRVAVDVLSQTPGSSPAIVAVPLDDGHTNLSVTILANLITMTPGTMSLDVSKDRRWLYIHAMFVDDVSGFRAEIKDEFERRVLEVFT